MYPASGDGGPPSGLLVFSNLTRSTANIGFDYCSRNYRYSTRYSVVNTHDTCLFLIYEKVFSAKGTIRTPADNQRVGMIRRTMFVPIVRKVLSKHFEFILRTDLDLQNPAYLKPMVFSAWEILIGEGFFCYDSAMLNIFGRESGQNLKTTITEFPLALEKINVRR